MDNERQSSLPSSLLPHLYSAPNKPRDSGTRTTIDSDDDHTDPHQISPVQFPFAPPRRIYTQTVQPHPQQQPQRPFLSYDLDEQPSAGGSRDVGHQHQIMYNDSLLPSSTRPIMPVSRPASSYSYPPLQPPASRQQQLASGTSTATRTTWNEGEPGPSSLLHHQQQQDSRAARHRRGESLSPRVPPHIDPFSRRTANYEHDPASFGQHVVRRDAEKDLYFSSLHGTPTIPPHQQHLQHQQSQQHPQHQSVSNYFAQQPQPHSHSQNYSNQQQHSQHEQYQHRHQHALSTSQSLSESRSQQHFFIPSHDDDPSAFTFAAEPQSYGGSYSSVNSLPPNTPSPHFPSSSSSGGEGSSSSYSFYHRSTTLPNEPTHAEHRSDDHSGHAIHLTHPTRPNDPDYDHLGHADGGLLSPERAERAPSRSHPRPWYPTPTRSSTDLRNGPLFSMVSLRDYARTRIEGLSRIIPMDVDERSRERELDLNKDGDTDWETHWGANPGGSTAVSQSFSAGGAPEDDHDHAEGGTTGGAVSASASSGSRGGRRGKNKTSADKRRRADIGDADELARQNKGAAVRTGYRHDQKVWQREEAQAKRPKKTLVACDFCRGRKLRCDGARPFCGHCVARGLACMYAKFARRRGPGKAPRGARAKKNAEARAIAESSVVFKNGVDPMGFKAKPPGRAEGGGANPRGGRRKGGAGAASSSAPAQWPASLVGMRVDEEMIPEGAGLSMGGTRLPGPSGPNNFGNKHDYELEMLAPEVRPYASVMTLDTLGPVPSSHHRQPQGPAPALRGYGGAETFYDATDPSLAPRMTVPDAGGTAAGNVGSDLGGGGMGSMRRSGGPVGVGTSSSLSMSTSGGPGSMSVSGAGYGFEGPSPAPHYPPAPPPDLRYDTTEQGRVFRDNGGGMQGMNMGMDMGGGGGMMDGETISGNGGPGSASGYNYSRETRERSRSSETNE